MSISIEIPDSDDDMPKPTIDMAKSINSDSEFNEHTPEKLIKLTASATTTPTKNRSVSSETAGSSPASVNSSIGSGQPNPTQVRHRSRKTQHTVRNAAENEIQFETIPVDDLTVNLPAQEVSAERGLSKSTEEKLKTVIGNMVNTSDVQAIVQRIAKERVRCNFLLATYQLPDMNFALNTSVEVLKQQFHERIKMRRERINAAAKAAQMLQKTKVEKL